MLDLLLQNSSVLERVDFSVRAYQIQPRTRIKPLFINVKSVGFSYAKLNPILIKCFVWFSPSDRMKCVRILCSRLQTASGQVVLAPRVASGMWIGNQRHLHPTKLCDSFLWCLDYPEFTRFHRRILLLQCFVHLIRIIQKKLYPIINLERRLNALYLGNSGMKSLIIYSGISFCDHMRIKTTSKIRSHSSSAKTALVCQYLVVLNIRPPQN